MTFAAIIFYFIFSASSAQLGGRFFARAVLILILFFSKGEYTHKYV